MNNDIVFVILHYQLLSMTVQCVNSIKSCSADAKIIIVDNFSPNQSGEKLKKLYENDSAVYVLSTNGNLGFANGNNVGYKYAKKVLNAKFICCINNDTYILNHNFNTIIEQEYKLSKFAVMAPKAYLPDNTIQSFLKSIKDIEYYKKELRQWKTNSTYKEYLKSVDNFTRIYLKYPKVKSLIRKVKQFFTSDLKTRMEDVVLHGCFLIFSPSYIEKYEDAFDTRTFMYREEELLYLRLKHSKLVSVYNPELEILHLENAATNSDYSGKEKKYQFMRENQIKSLKILIDTLGEKGEIQK